MSEKAPPDRLNYIGDLDPVVDRLCRTYNIGKPINFSVIEIGYEDCNVIIESQSGKYVAKMFSKIRSKADIIRYSTIMEKAEDAGVNLPPLIKTVGGTTVFVDQEASGISMVLMRFIDGNTFLQLDRAPDSEERRAVIEQAAIVNKVIYHPPYLLDSWAIPNIKPLFERVKRFIQLDDIGLVEKAIKQYTEIPIEKLPHCFVHGDFTKSNVMKGNDGKIYILDFSVANWYPRIQELAVIVANLLHSTKNYVSLRDRIKLVLEEYSALSSLTPEEQNYLYPYALAGVAMEFMGAHQEKYINGNDTEETEFWLELGREGLRKELI